MKEKLVNLRRTHEKIKLVKGKLVKENLVVCAGLKTPQICHTQVSKTVKLLPNKSRENEFIK